ncbi:HepT-like ribonuclease domain-containing protein [Leekyejoonella antrihumi]|nr:HepT-like ribonuclease domain-containing protein [Leekyejoonella antrihumi]
MRNILIHGYAEVNNLTVWRAATESLDELMTAVETILAEIGSPDCGL